MNVGEEKRLQEWEQKKKTVTLTNGQWSSLTMYLNMSRAYREDEKNAWEKLAEELDEEGNPKFKHAASNAEFWKKMNETIKIIKTKVDDESCKGQQEG